MAYGTQAPSRIEVPAAFTGQTLGQRFLRPPTIPTTDAGLPEGPHLGIYRFQAVNDVRCDILLRSFDLRSPPALLAILA
jgi:hypothetical protein